MKAVWKRIEAWLSEHAPNILDDLLEGATAEQIAAAEKVMQVNLPAQVRASYQVHNGQAGRSAPLLGEWQCYSLSDMVDRWQLLKKLEGEGTFAQAAGEPIGPIQPKWWTPKWIPVAYNGGGDLYCLDLAPTKGGKRGQLITFWHMDPRREILASSFKAWLTTFADDLEGGSYTVEDGILVRVEQR